MISKRSQDHKNNFLKRYKLCNCSLNLGKMAVQNKTIVITQKDRYKYVQRPVVPFIPSKTQTVSYTIPYHTEPEVLNSISRNARRQCYIPSSKLELHKNAGTQTDYRENEAQTEPWEPPCKIVSDHNSEVLTLTDLTWKHGLPAGIHEVHVINRMRMKKAWEAILPPMNTPANIKMRNSIIAALEIDEWAFRESEIQSMMDIRLKLMRQILQRRGLQYKKKLQDRFNRLQDKLGKRRDEQVKVIRNNLKRDLRKLDRKLRDKQRFCRSDIIEQYYSDSTSDLYAARMDFGEHPQKRQKIPPQQFLNIDLTEEDENAVLNWLPTIKEPKVAKYKFKPIDICIRQTKWTEEKLKKLHSDLKAIRLNIKSADTIPTLMKRNYKQAPLPVTPRRSDIWNSKQENLEESAKFIQKIVKGRTIQCLTYEGRDRCRELIEELQSTHALEQQDEQKCRDEKIRMIELQRVQNEKLMQEDRLCEILDSLEGKTVCGTLDFLSKELIRLKDERKAHAFALLAERERCKREAAEAGRRQMERHRRREFEEMFKQIVKVNQDSVEAYLEDIIKEGVDWISDKMAKEHISELCDKMDKISVLNNVDVVAEEELVADMIYNFVLPEVEKRNMRRKIKEQEQDHMRNAYISIYEKMLNLPVVESSQVTDEETCIKNDEIEILFVHNMEDNTEEEIDIAACKTDVKNNKRTQLALQNLQNDILVEESTAIIRGLLDSIIENVIISMDL